MCGSSTTTTSTPQQSAQQAGIWNAATGSNTAQGALPPMPQVPGMTPEIWAQINQGNHPATNVAGPALPTTAPVYGQPTVAGINGDQQASYQAVRDAMGQAQPGLLASSNMAQAAGGYQPGLISNPNLGPAAQTATPGAVQAQVGPAATSAGAGAGVGLFPQAVGAAATAGQASTSMLPQTDLSGYMNPYTSNVIDTTNAQIERARQTAQAQTSGQALTAGAFGGSRSGVMGSLTNQAYDQDTASTDAGLNQANYTQAAANAQTDLARQAQVSQTNAGLTTNANIASANNATSASGINAQTGLQAGITNANLAQGNNQFNASAVNQNNQYGAGLLASTGLANNQLAASVGQSNTTATNQQNQYGAGLLASVQGQNQQAGLTANGQSLQAAGLLGSNAVAGQNAALQGATALNQAGTQQQTTDQNQLSSAFNQWQQQQNYPFQYYNFLSGLATPGSNTTTQTTQQSPLGTIAGLATSAAGLLGGGGVFGGNPTLTPTTINTSGTPSGIAPGVLGPIAPISIFPGGSN